jgi:beta-glucosidase
MMRGPLGRLSAAQIAAGAVAVATVSALLAVQAGREYNTTDMSEQQLRNIYLPPYKAAVDAGAATVMSAFTSLDGCPTPPTAIC